MVDLKMERFLTRAEYAIQEKTERMMNDEYNNYRQDLYDAFLHSLTDEESKEYWDLVKASQDAEEARYVCCDKDQPVPSCCNSPVQKEHFDSTCAGCPIIVRIQEAQRKVGDFASTHGKHFCYDCIHYGFEFTGCCAKHDTYHLPTDCGCKDYRYCTEDDSDRISKVGVYCTPEEWERREKNIRDNREKIAERRRAHREKTAKRFALDLHNNRQRCRGMMRSMAYYYEGLFDEFPEIFRTYSPCKTFDEVLKWLELKREDCTWKSPFTDDASNKQEEETDHE